MKHPLLYVLILVGAASVTGVTGVQPPAQQAGPRSGSILVSLARTRKVP